jgi:hypothetical protein
MDPRELILLLTLALFAVPVAAWWLGRRFWQQSSVQAIRGASRYRTIVELVLLACLWNLLLYGVSAVLLLPWAKGLGHSRSDTLGEWQEAYLQHELFVLAISGLGGSLTLYFWQRWRAALCWLAGCVLLLAGVHGHRTYADRMEALEEQRMQQVVGTPFLVNDSLGYAKRQLFYDAEGKAAAPSTLPLRRAIPFEKIAQKPSFPGGELALQEAIQQRLRYPWAAQGQQVPVDIVVECIVEPTGQLTVLYTSEAPTPCEGLGYEQEAVRVVRNLPAFIPGQRAGRPVAVTYTISVAFRPVAISDKHPH